MKNQSLSFFAFFLSAAFLSIGQGATANPTLTATGIHAGNKAGWGFVQCTNIVDPSNGDTNVPVTTAISWDPAAGDPVAYILMVGTTPGGTEILNQDVGNVTTYDPPGNLPAGVTIYVTVIGYNANGPATGCAEESFTTAAGGAAPACTGLTNPTGGATNVPTTSSLSWAAATGNPTGYRLDVGITPGGTEILDNFDAGNVTTYDPPGVFPNSAVIYVKVTPYNSNGDAAGCAEESFTTEFCTANLLIVSDPVPSGTYWSTGDLTSHSSRVAAGSAVVFKAETAVLLQFDFTVEAGAEFEAKIESCQ